MRLIAALLVVLVLPLSLDAHSVTIDGIEVIHPNIPAPPASAKSAAVYMAISNNTAEAERLIGVETPLAKQAALHTTEQGTGGVVRMIKLEGVDIPAGETVVLEPGGMHVMLMGLTGQVREGDMVPATLIFEKAGRVDLEFMVDPAEGMDHSTMSHDATGAGD